MDANGSYYASDRYVFRSPKRNPKTGGISMGFCVCKLVDGVDDDGAQEIADALNAAESKQAEPGSNRSNGHE